MSKKMAVPSDVTPGARLVEEDLQQVVGYQLAQASIITNRVFQEAVGGPFDLRPVEYTILALIQKNPGGSAAQLAKALAVTAPNITMWLDRLEARQLVQRLRSETDRRAQRLQLTAQACKLMDQATPRLLAGERLALGALSAGERAYLVELLHKVAACRSHPGKPPTLPAEGQAPGAHASRRRTAEAAPDAQPGKFND